MSLNIFSETIDNPLLIDLLRRLTDVFGSIGHDFFVIGATARDIVLQVLSGVVPSRRTKDLDIAIAVTGWSEYDVIKQAMVDNGFEKARLQAQRFYYGDYEIDVVPYGEVAKDDDNIYWPPEETIAMSVKGFDEVLENAVTVSIDNEFEIKIASLHGLFLLKFNAWLDRSLFTDKDAQDMWCIIDNYYLANDSRGVHPEVYDLDNFDLIIGGCYWLAHDIADLLDERTLAYYHDALEKEVSKADESRLVRQILGAEKSVKPAEIIGAFSQIVDVMARRLNHDKD